MNVISKKTILFSILMLALSVIGCSETPEEPLTIDEVEVVKPEPDTANKTIQASRPDEP